MYRMHFLSAPGLWWLIGLVSLIVLLGALIWLLVVVSRSRSASTHQPWQPPAVGAPPPIWVPRPTPHDILRERLARGEISVEEYERTRVALGPDPFGPSGG